MPAFSGFARSEISRTVIGSRPATMPPEPEVGGDYFPTVLSLSNGDLPDGWPVEWHTILYTSTDHDERASPVGGIYLRACNGDPTLPASWKEWDEISGNAEFAYLFTDNPATPTTNPIFIDTVAGDQTETPCVNKLDDGAVILTYHNRHNNTYDNAGDIQNTCISEGTDGVNFTRTGILFTYNPRFRIGNGHTGYFNWGLNTSETHSNPATGLPWKYAGNALNGGAGRGLGWQYGSDDGRNWTSIGPRKAGRGRLKGDFPTDTDGFDYNYGTQYYNGVQEGPYTRIQAGSSRVGLFGGALPKSSKYEALIDKQQNIVAFKPFALAGGVGDFDEAGLQGGADFKWNNREFTIYVAVDANNYNLPAILEYQTVPHTWTLVTPNFGTPATLLEENFPAGSAVPNTIQIASAPANSGSMAVDPSWDRLELTTTGGVDRARMHTVNAYAPDGYAYMDFEIVGMQCAAEINISRLIKIASNPDSTQSQTQQIILKSYNEDATLAVGDSTVNLRFRAIGNVVADVSADSGFEWGYSDSYNDGFGNRESSRAPMFLKIRIVPSLDLAVLMVDNSEIVTVDITGWDYTIPMYVYIENDGNDAGTNTIQINKLAVYAGLDVAPANPTPPTMTQTAGDGEITFSCPSVAGATGYKAFYGTNGIYEEADFGASTGGTVTGLTNDTAYSVFMRTYNAEGDSEPSAIESSTPSNASSTAATVAFELTKPQFNVNSTSEAPTNNATINLSLSAPVFSIDAGAQAQGGTALRLTQVSESLTLATTTLPFLARVNYTDATSKRLWARDVAGTPTISEISEDRYFTTFDRVAQTQITLSNPVTLTGDFEIECYAYRTGTPWGALLCGPSTRLSLVGSGGNYKVRLHRETQSDLSTPDNSFDNSPVLKKVTVKRIGSTASIAVDGGTETTGTVAGDIVFDSIGYDTSGMGGTDILDGMVTDLKIWDGGDRNSGTLVLDMPIDKQYGTNPIVENRETVLGSDLIPSGSFETDSSTSRPDSNTWAFNYSGSFASILRDMDFFTGLEGGVFEVTTTVVANAGFVQIYMGGTGDVQSVGNGTNTYLLTHGGDNRLQIASAEFDGSLTISVKEIPATNPIGKAILFVDSDSEQFTFDADYQWVGEELWSYGDYTYTGSEGSFSLLAGVYASPLVYAGNYKYEAEYNLTTGSVDTYIKIGNQTVVLDNSGAYLGTKTATGGDDLYLQAGGGAADSAGTTVTGVSVKRILEMPE